MDPERARNSYGGAGSPPFSTNGHIGPLTGRPPPGLSRNSSFPHNNNGGQGVSPPPGLGHSPFSFPVSSQNSSSLYHQQQHTTSTLTGYPFYSPPQSPYTSPNNFQNFEIGMMAGSGGSPPGYPYHQSQPQFEAPLSGRGLGLGYAGPSLSRKSSMENSSVYSDGPPDSAQDVIKPMIENLMGSMGASDGTYSHFGPPSASVVAAFQMGNSLPSPSNESNVIGGGKGSSVFGRVQVQHPTTVDPFHSTLEGQFQLKMEHKIRQKQLLLQQQQQQQQGFSGNSGSLLKSVIGSGKQSPINLSTPVGNNENGQIKTRPSTPNGFGTGSKEPSLESNSRPQTPGKPSYLEMLTKNCPAAPTKSAARRTSSGSQGFQQPDFTAAPNLPSFGGTYAQHVYPLSQVHNQSHRKSLDGFTTVGSSSTPSNSSTASSSPVNKPKAQQKGKENFANSANSSASSSKASTSKNNTPAGTPVHSAEAGGKKGPAQTNNGWIKKLPGRSLGRKSNSGTNNSTVVNAAQSPFEFDIDDLDDEENEVAENSVSLSSEGDEKSTGSKKSRNREKKSNGGGDHGGNNNNNGAADRRISASETSKCGGTNGGLGSGLPFGGRKARERNEKPRSRKEERNCIVRRLRMTSKQWLGHLVKALTWFWTLLLNVTTLSVSLGCTLTGDFVVWWKASALPTCRVKLAMIEQKTRSFWRRLKDYMQKKKPAVEKNEKYDGLLSVIGPERNIALPVTGDDALKRLLSVRGQDPYSILGVRSDSPEDTIRRYYKKQAVLVHPDKNLVPGAEEAFKILAKAFEMVGEPVNRLKFHQQLLEAHAKERFMGEFGSLFEELRKKMETACSTIRCTKCKARHKKNRTDRPLFAARFCAQCRIHHGAREGELWAEKTGMFGLSWQYYACMANQIWEINEWGRCQRSSLKHLEPNAHSVLYRLVSGGQGNGNGRPPPGPNSAAPQDEDDLFDPENLEKMDDWDSLINNLCRNSPAAAAGSGSMPTSGHGNKGSATRGPGNGSAHSMNGTPANGTAMNNSSAGKKRKGKRK